MKKILLASCLFAITITGFSQSYNISWGEEIKLKKGTADLDIVMVDNTGLFFTEERVKLKSYFVIGATYGSSHKLVKLDKNFSEVFDKEYKKELKGLDFHSFQPLENELYLFSTDYNRKDKQFIILGAKVDKNSGDIPGDFQELGSYGLESKRDNYEMRISPIQNGKAFLMVTNISNKDRVSLAISVLDKTLKRKESAVINLSFNPGLYQLQDVQFTKDNKIVILGKEFEEVPYGKKKRKRLVFKQYVMGVYDNDGKKEKDVLVDASDRYIISGKLIEQPTGELLLAGFYCNDAKKQDLNGFFINKLNPVLGEMTLSSFKEINAGMLGTAFEDEGDVDDESRASKKDAKKAKDEDDEEEFPNSYIIKSVDISPVDNSVIITSEVSKYSYYSYTSSTYNNSTRSWNHQTTHVHRFTNQDILVINADKDGNIKWINDLPKSQLEEIRTTNSGVGYGFSYEYDRGGYFAGAGGMPFYSSFASILLDNKLVLIMNDHSSNNVNPEYGTRVKTVSNFRKRSNVYGVSIDLASGKMTRKIIASNNDETVLMPRHSYVVGVNTNNIHTNDNVVGENTNNNQLIIPSWRTHMMAKTQLKFARITVR